MDTKIPWTLANSIFRPRLKEADSQNFLDTPVALQRTFEVDWGHACDKEKFTSMVVRENKAVKVRHLQSASSQNMITGLAVRVLEADGAEYFDINAWHAGNQSHDQGQ